MAAARSFSSFPLFNSFPDLDEPKASSSKAESSTNSKREKKEKKDKSEKKKSSHKHRRHDDDDRDERDREHRKKKRSSRTYKDYDLYDDERSRRKEEATAHDAIPANPLSGVDGDQPIFYSDRRGDHLNVTYGGLHSYDVPKYILCDRRRIMGLPQFSVIDRKQHYVSVAPGRGGKRKMPSLTDSSTRHLLAAPPKRRLMSLMSTNDGATRVKHKYEEDDDGFLRISSNRPPKQGDPSYRSITAADANADSDDASESDEGEAEQAEDSDDDDDEDTIPETSLQATLRSLEQELSAKPSSVSTWLSLLSHTLSTIPSTSKNASKARADISLSILSRALSAHPDNASSKQLRLKYMKAGEEVWTDTQLHAEWEKALESRDADVWMEWLDWRIRSGGGGIEGMVESALRTLAVFRSEDSELGELGQLRVLWRVAVAFRDAGYAERAMALLQAEAELLFHMPRRMYNDDFEDKLDALEAFWESELPRTGEPGATGWALWEASGRPEPTAPTSHTTSPRSSHADPYTRWAANELLGDRWQTLSARSFDDVDDPYATILFSDIRPLLVELLSPGVQNTFRLVWLSFLGLHIPGFSSALSMDPSGSLDDRWACHHLSSQAYLNSVFPSANASTSRITADASGGVLVGREKEYASPFGPVKSWSYGAFGIVDRLPGTQWGMWTQEDVSGAEIKIIREVFRQCKLSADDTDWDVLNVAFEAAVDVKSALKVSKSILSSVGDSLPRWAAHARLERMRDKPDAARKVYETVLSSAQRGSPGLSMLWWDWAEMEWLSGNSDAAMSVIRRCSGTEGSGGGGIATLRAKRSLEEAIAQTPATSSWTEREGWVKLRALLELLTSSAEAALGFLDTQLGGLEVGSVEHERLSVAALSLVYAHASILKRPTRQMLLRDRAQRAMEAYPNNTVVLGMFLEGERGQGVWGRVRAILGGGQEKEQEKDVARRVAEVWIARWEKSRWEAEQERTRSGLSAAVEHERTRGSAVLWRMYVEFEIRCGELRRAKTLLFRAVGACPLCKELYLLAFGALRSVFSGRELQDWAEVMVERGIRLRRGLDEELDGWREKEEGVKVEGEGEDEIEYNARELRRLRPY